MTLPKYGKKKITLPMLQTLHSLQSKILAVFCFCLIAPGCVPDNEVSIPSGKQYFPLQVGDYRVYHVEETLITPFNVEEDFVYDLKTVITDSFPNAEGNYSYIITRFKRMDANAPWESLDTWVARANGQELVVSEGNILYVKLTFPIKSNKEWNANAYNNLETNELCEATTNVISCDVYSIENFPINFETTGGLTFDNALEVIENDDPDVLIEHDVRKSIYAYNVGLIYKEVVLLKYCTAGDCYGKQLIEDGLIYKQELIEYGHE